MWFKAMFVCMCSPWFVALGCCCWVQLVLQEQTNPPALVLFCPRRWKGTQRSVSFSAPNKRQEWDKYSGICHRNWRSERSLPRVCWPTEHLTAVFDDVLVAVWVLDSVLTWPGSFYLVKTKRTKLSALVMTNFTKNHILAWLQSCSVFLKDSLLYTLFKSIAPFLDVIPTGMAVTY